eukprot:scaffold1147_cov68-Phaeocystis_antarctica.AAC.12
MARVGRGTRPRPQQAPCDGSTRQARAAAPAAVRARVRVGLRVGLRVGQQRLWQRERELEQLLACTQRTQRRALAR